VISRVGNDAEGRELIERLKKLGLPTNCIEVDSSLPTGTVTVTVAADGQPHFTIHENVAWDFITTRVVALVERIEPKRPQSNHSGPPWR
jgi:fructokinase